jgi:dihydrofolate reductase
VVKNVTNQAGYSLDFGCPINGVNRMIDLPREEDRVMPLPPDGTCTASGPGMRRTARWRRRAPARLRWVSQLPLVGRVGDVAPEYERPPANSDRALISCLHRAGLDSRNRLTERHGAMRKLIYGMNLTLDGYIAAPGDDLGWSGPSDELFQWWLDQELAIGLLMYGRKLWETMSSYWPTGDQQPGATPAQIEFARNWRDTPKVVFSSTVGKVDWNTRLVTGDAVAEITRLKAEDGEPMRVGGAARDSFAACLREWQHQDPAVTSRYLHPDQQSMLDAGAAFSAWWSVSGP